MRKSFDPKRYFLVPDNRLFWWALFANDTHSSQRKPRAHTRVRCESRADFGCAALGPSQFNHTRAVNANMSVGIGCDRRNDDDDLGGVDSVEGVCVMYTHNTCLL